MIDQLRKKIALGQVEYSLHAVRQMVARNITPEEVAQTVLAGEVIEDYPDDKYGPSCLLFGRTAGQRALHVQCTLPAVRCSRSSRLTSRARRNGTGH